MILKWKRYQHRHYCYGEDGQILAELYEDVLTGHCTADIISKNTHQHIAFGKWMDVVSAQVAVEEELKTGNYSTTIGIC